MTENVTFSSIVIANTSPKPVVIRPRLFVFSVNYYELTVELNADQEDTVSNMVFVLNGELASTDRLPGWR